jgi:hypothetical protein
VNLKNHMKNLKSSAFNKMDNLSKGINALRNLGNVSRKSSRRTSRSPNYGSRSRKARIIDRKIMTQNYAMNNYLKPVVSENVKKRKSKRAKSRKKSTVNNQSSNNNTS